MIENSSLKLKTELPIVKIIEENKTGILMETLEKFI